MQTGGTTEHIEKPKGKGRRLSKKQRGFVKDYIASEGNGTQAALKNYDIQGKNKENIAASIANENLTKPAIVNALHEVLSDELLAKVHAEGLEANRVISANITYGDADEKTNDFIEVPDHAVRSKFLDMAYKIRGSYAAEKHASLNVNVTAEVDDEALALAAKLYGEAVIQKKTI